MNHYSDIGFIVEESKDITAIFDNIMTKKHGSFKTWDLSKHRFLNKNKIVYYIFSLGEIRYCLKLDEKHHKVLNLSLGHNNEKITEVVFDEIAKTKPIDIGLDFPHIQVVKNDIPFCFSCLNYDLFKLKLKDKIKIKIASFANYVKIKEKKETEPIAELTPEEAKNKLFQSLQSGEFPLSDEGYIAYWNEDPAYSLFSGIITDIKKEKNIISTREYYCINADCLDMKFALLVDKDELDTNLLKVGNIIFGEFWNTCLIVDDN